MHHRLDLFPSKELIVKYRAIAANRMFPEVFAHMMFELGTFQDSMSTEDTVLKNYGLRLLKIFGGGEVDGNTLKSLLKNLTGQALPEDEGT